VRERCVDCGGPIAGTCCGHGWKRRAADATAEVIATRADRDQLARERDASTDAIARLVKDHRARIAALEQRLSEAVAALRRMYEVYGHGHYTDAERERGLTKAEIEADAAARAALAKGEP